MADFSKITETLLAKVVGVDDVDAALFEFQTMVGIDDGGVAGVVFSGGWDGEWPTATVERRHTMMAHYINLERVFAEDDADGGDHEECDPGVAWEKAWL